MTRQEIIAELEALKEPSRALDQAIAVLFDYNRAKITEAGREVIVWYDPKGRELRVVPFFTANVDDAKSLLDILLPKEHAGFSFHDDHYKAQVGDREAVTAFNPATALTLAVIKAVQPTEGL
ncbi:hypothetical protein [Rhizobium phage RHph_X2_25]|nr:hypothetical protein [Rhizobium phage RHph_X2_25]